MFLLRSADEGGEHVFQFYEISQLPLQLQDDPVKQFQSDIEQQLVHSNKQGREQERARRQ